MQFRTEFKPDKASFMLDPGKPLLLLGSCFAQNVGTMMRNSLWDAEINPCGVLFNPASIGRAIGLAAGVIPVSPAWQASDGTWRNWDFPTSFASSGKDDCMAGIRAAIGRLRERLATTQAVIATFGTAIVYELASEPGHIVANCHKRPQQEFIRRRMDIDEITAIWKETAGIIRDLNPGCRIILTVSPVRHVREGFEANSRSKAALLLAAEQICRDVAGCCYFPAFEIMTDDLRDYRFCADDMLHPSEQATAYIYSKFRQMFLSPGHESTLRDGEALARRCSHRLLMPESETALRFSADTAAAVSRWRTGHPSMLTPDMI